MPFNQPSTTPEPESPVLADAALFVGEGLSGRSKAATSGQQRRLVKTLERLYPAATAALAGVAAGNAGVAAQSFESVLAQLSNA